MGKAQERIKAVLGFGESILAEAPFGPPGEMVSGGGTFAAAVTDRRILIFEANSLLFGANTGKLVREELLSSVDHVEIERKLLWLFFIPAMQVIVYLSDGDAIAMTTTGIGVPRLKRFASKLQALVEAQNGHEPQEERGV